MNSVLDNDKRKCESEFEESLRPLSFDNYIGQNTLKNNLKVFIVAAKNRNEVLDHVLLYGPPGLGKTTLAHIIANEMSSKLIITNGPSIEKTGDLASILSSIEPGDCLFIDEIHRMPRFVEEILYSAMEDFKLNIIVSSESTSSNISIDLPPFTLIGATTKVGDLSSPLRSRFGIAEKLNFYSIEELCEIINRTSKILNCTIDKESQIEIAKRSRGSPRITNRILKRVRDFANFENNNQINLNLTIDALNRLKIEENGLSAVDLNYLYVLQKRFNCGPVGLETISSAIGEDSVNLEEVNEPYLLKLGFIDRTQKGRVLTQKGKNYLKKIKSNNKLLEYIDC